MEINATVELLKDKYVVLRKWKDDAFPLFVESEALIYVKHINISENFAAYTFQFIPICGDYKQYFCGNVLELENHIKVGLISYGFGDKLAASISDGHLAENRTLNGLKG